MKRQPSEQGNIFIDNNSIEDWCQEYTKDSKRVNAKKTFFFKIGYGNILRVLKRRNKNVQKYFQICLYI